MSNQNYQNEQSDWKSKAKRWGVGLVTVGLFIAVFAVAIGARNQAIENAETVLKPEWKVSYVPGGPLRFPDAFEDVEDDDRSAEMEPNRYLWSTVIITNTGEAEAINASADITTTVPVSHAFVSSDAYLLGLGMEGLDDDDMRSVSADIGELSPEETVLVFLAMSPTDIPGPPYDEATRKDWLKDYSAYLNKIRVESDSTAYLAYGSGYIPASEEEGTEEGS